MSDGVIQDGLAALKGVDMKIDSSRFGPIEVDPQRLITLSGGLLGYANHERYALIESDSDGFFFWLQSTEDARLAFVVTDPALFLPAYRPPLRREQLNDLGLTSAAEAQTLVIVNKHHNTLTGNLKGPIVIDPQRRVGRQLVLAEARYSAKHVLIHLDAKAPTRKEAALV
ncbi:MAG: flagellar assembly protein FliW [Phycisphaera sp.]|nr:flagellar assembly protein FliW [Phycisphaera sp.]